MKQWNICVLGLSITSSWGNGHATTFRALIKQLHKQGHQVTFLERNVPWYASQRDLPHPEYCQLHLYDDLEELKEEHAGLVADADLVIVGSYVPEGVEVGKWVISKARGTKAFYDIDTPVTLAKLERGDYEYLHPDLIPQYDIYFSFTGGPILDLLENKYGSPAARPLYCSVDADMYFPTNADVLYDLGYLGTYSDDRQPPLKSLLIDAASTWPDGRFAVVGPQYPADISWPQNVYRLDHLAPAAHGRFYNSQRFTLNITRADMIKAGYSPSVRLFEAAACGTPIISDYWPGLNSFFDFNSEILISYSAEDTLRYLRNMSEEERLQIGRNARQKILERHTSAVRAQELIKYTEELIAI